MKSKVICAFIAVTLFVMTNRGVAEETEGGSIPQTATDNLVFLEKAYAARTKRDAEEWKRQVAAKHAELAASLDWLVAHDRGKEALRFVIPFAHFLSASNEQKQAAAALARVLQLPSAGAATTARAEALYHAGLLAFRQRDHEKSRALNEESLKIARKLNDRAAIATALIGLSRLALRAHDYKLVKSYAQEAGDLRKAISDEAGSISATHMVAAAARMEGDDARAQQIYESTLATYRATGEKRRAAGELFNLGYVQLHQNQEAKARDLFMEALQEYRAIKDESGIGYCLTGFAALAAVQKQSARAAQLYGAAAAILERLGITLDPDDQLDLDRYSKIARDQMSATSYANEYEQGQKLTADQAISRALGRE